MKKILFGLFTVVLMAGCNPNEPIYDDPGTTTRAITMSNDGNGTAVADPTEATEGTAITIAATPTGDYQFKQWTVVSGGATLSSTTTSPATFTMPAAAVEIKAEFEAISRTVTMSNDGNGTATATPANAVQGTTVTITATPNANYQFKQWTVISSGATLSSTTTNPATFTMPAGVVEIKAEFEDLKRTVTMSNDGNGTAVAAPANAAQNATVTITATPATNYQFKQWTVVSGGVTLSSTTTNPAMFTMPATGVEIRAEFTFNLFTAIANALPGATLSVPAGNYNIPVGTRLDITKNLTLTGVGVVSINGQTPPYLSGLPAVAALSPGTAGVSEAGSHPAIVVEPGVSLTMNNIIVTSTAPLASNLVDGITVLGSSASLTLNNCTITNIYPGPAYPTGAQNGRGVTVFGNSQLIATGTTFSHINKNAIHMFETSNATMTSCTITGANVLGVQAQNGFVFSYGTSGSVDYCSFSNLIYNGGGCAAVYVIYDGVSLPIPNVVDGGHNTYSNNDIDWYVG